MGEKVSDLHKINFITHNLSEYHMNKQHKLICVPSKLDHYSAP